MGLRIRCGFRVESLGFRVWGLGSGGGLTGLGWFVDGGNLAPPPPPHIVQVMGQKKLGGTEMVRDFLHRPWGMDEPMGYVP